MLDLKFAKQKNDLISPVCNRLSGSAALDTVGIFH